MKISVVIPAYNEARYLGACLRSLQQQTRPADEIIVVDNGSTDDTAAIARAFGVRLLSESHRGVCAARQTGTAAATGEIVISTDADTTFPATWLATIEQAFINHPQAVGVSGGTEYVGAPWWGRYYARLLFGISRFFYRYHGRLTYISACNTAFRKSAWTGYNPKLTQGGDEFGLLTQLHDVGPVIPLPESMVFTSSRRLRRGLWYNFFVTILWYYMIDYTFGQLTGRSMFGSYAPIREEKMMATPLRIAIHTVVVLGVILGAYSIVDHHALASRLVRSTGARLESWTDHLSIHDRR